MTRLGLVNYTALFQKEAIDYNVLMDMKDSDLEKIGLPFG
jgi:hypothetical protein